LHSPFEGFNGAENDALPLILHGSTEEDKGKELTLGGFKSSLLVDRGHKSESFARVF
jgi:hypothetical protein